MKINIQMTKKDYEANEAYLEQMSLDLNARITVTDIDTNELIMIIAGIL